MSADLLIERLDDRVHYLASKGSYRHGLEFSKESSYAHQVNVIRFTDDPQSGVILQLSAGAFSFQNGMSVAEARLLALALNTAADEADAAATEGVTGDAQ